MNSEETAKLLQDLFKDKVLKEIKTDPRPVDMFREAVNPPVKPKRKR